ncbi:MAG: sterol desaturase family protein [Ferruginibacter sp.]
MQKNYISNAEDSIKLFKNNILDSLSKVHFTVPLYIYIPAILFFAYKSFTHGIYIGGFVIYFAAGLLTWTITEYFLHRFVFHYHPTSEFGKKMHFIFHGVHHDYPRDKKRLVMPPSASIPLATLFYFLFSLVLQQQLLFAFFPGFLLGYLIYDMLHYAMHHHNFKNPILKKMKQHHMLHHYKEPSKGFGVSSSLWDVLLKSDFPRQHNKS